MAAPSALAQMGLDIRPYQTALNDVIRNNARLETSSRVATAQLRLMERAFAQMGAASGVTIAQIDAQRMAVEDLNTQLTEGRRDAAALSDALGQGGRNAHSFSSFIGRLKSNLLGMAVGFATYGVMSYVRNIGNLGKELQDVSAISGATAEGIQRIQGALGDKVSADDATQALTAFSKAVRDASTDADKAAALMDTLGLSAGQLSREKPEELFLRLGDAVKDSINPQETLNALIAIFGEDQARKVNPALAEGTKLLRERAAAASVVNDETTALIAEGSRALDVLSRAATTLPAKIAGAWLGLRRAVHGVGEFDLSGANDFAERMRQASENHVPGSGRSPADVQLNTAPKLTREQQKQESLRKKQAADAERTLKADKESTALQSQVARSTMPDLLKQRGLLLAQQKTLVAAAKAATGEDQKRKQLAVEQNQAALRGNMLAIRLSKIDKELNERRARSGVGYFEDQATALAEIESVQKRIAALLKATNGRETAETAALRAEENDLNKALIDRANARRAELQSLRSQIEQVQLQRQGLTGLASEAAVRAEYEEKIVAAINTQNHEARQLLETQEKLAMSAETVRRYREDTPRAMANARREARRFASDERKQLARDAEIARRESRGIYGSPLMDTARKRRELEAARRERIEQAKQSAQNLPDNVQRIREIIEKGE